MSKSFNGRNNQKRFENEDLKKKDIKNRKQRDEARELKTKNQWDQNTSSKNRGSW